MRNATWRPPIQTRNGNFDCPHSTSDLNTVYDLYIRDKQYTEIIMIISPTYGIALNPYVPVGNDCSTLVLAATLF